ncbi:MAG: tetratricopeptide repeat protein [Clostridiales bacterium]|nr:tetratricopeptide repeat protein [Clostridiales bacterium]
MAKKKAKRRLRKNHLFVYIVIFIAGSGLVLTSVLGYFGFRSFASSPGRNEIAELEYKIGQLKDSLEKDPNNEYFLTALGDSYFDLGVAYSEAKKDDKASESFAMAIEPYGKVLEAKPEKVDVRVDMAVSAFWSGNHELAAAEFEEAIAIDPKHVKAHFNYGVFLFYGLNKPADAIKRFEEVLELGSNDPGLIATTQFLMANAEDQLKNPVFDSSPQN